MRNREQQALVLAVMVAAASLAGGCGQPRRGFVFDVAADMRFYAPPEYVGPKYFAGVCQAIRELGPGDFMVVLGDLDPPARVRATLDEVLGKEYVWYPVVGNHELDEPEHMPYLRACNPGGNSLRGIVRSGPPGAVETCYSFDHENAHFAVINQYYDGQSDGGTDGDVGDALYQWLKEDMAENAKPIVFVFGHEPFVSVPDMGNGRVRHRGDSLDKYAENNHRFWSLLRGYDVVAYFCGHTHNASVSRINGVWQIDCGHARGIGDPGAASTFVRVFVNGGEVVCAVYRQVGEGGPYRLVYEGRLR
jgi:hypothetical protein